MITINDKAQEYILTKGGYAYVLHGDGATLCCGRIDFGPSVRLGKPLQVEDYVLLVMNEIHVYLPKNFYTPNPLVIGLGNFLGMRTLRIEGWKLI